LVEAPMAVVSMGAVSMEAVVVGNRMYQPVQLI
jgi:hypothetical protein